ncbi:hypothetical protein HXX02_10120 [Microbulbifer elongatus]|uniref:Uncharacterized protein n=1 Tax=Microbulbifer elongatus TaxID=86173 RepID=A0ABT1P104_9GAMM|nr:hypothetical protein [Microbulbifer elongatus]MCQ3829800.1 hypothetical protein [Microbulbifer elongatus]
MGSRKSPSSLFGRKNRSNIQIGSASALSITPNQAIFSDTVALPNKGISAPNPQTNSHVKAKKVKKALNLFITE